MLSRERWHVDHFLLMYPARTYNTHTDSARTRLQSQNRTSREFSGTTLYIDARDPHVHVKGRCVQQEKGCSKLQISQSPLQSTCGGVAVAGFTPPGVTGTQNARIRCGIEEDRTVFSSGGRGELLHTMCTRQPYAYVPLRAVRSLPSK